MPWLFYYPKWPKKQAQNGHYKAFTIHLLSFEGGSLPGKGGGIVNQIAIFVL